MRLDAWEDLHRRHWRKRWDRPGRLDHWMGGRGIGPENRRALDAILALGAGSVLEVGPGCWRFAEAALLAGLRVAAVELPLPRAAALRPEGVEVVHAWRAHPLPWEAGAFDVVYQRNAVPNMPGCDVPRALDEMRRVARVLVWSGDLRCRFAQRRSPTGQSPGAWMRAELEKRWRVEHEHGKLLVLVPR